MEYLKDYITERIRIDNIKLMNFPIDGSFEEMVEYLKGCGFVEIFPNLPTFVPTFDMYRKNLDKMECTTCEFRPDLGGSSHNKALRFVNTSKQPISKSNPIFCVFYRTSTNEFEYYIEISEYWQKRLTKPDFLRGINKIFGWE
jgi:hypothetical protein